MFYSKPLIRFAIVFGIAFFVNSCDKRMTPSFDEKQVKAFIDDHSELSNFEQKHGPITKFALTPFIGAAANYTSQTYADVNKLVNTSPTVHSTAGQFSLSQGPHHLEIRDSSGQNLMGLGQLEFKNTSSEKAALILESTGLRVQWEDLLM